MFRGFSISGKRRSALRLGGGEVVGGLALVVDGGISGQRRNKVSMIKNEKNVLNRRK